MYVPHAKMTQAYRGAIVEMGFAPCHADLVDVDVAGPHIGTSHRIPLYRLTTGSAVARDGRTVRRVLMIWYVYSDGDVLAETHDRAAMAQMIIETFALLPRDLQGTMMPPPSWAKTMVARSTRRTARQAA